MNWEAPQFWIDGGFKQNVAYGSICDGTDYWRGYFNGGRTSNEAEYLTLLTLLSHLKGSYDSGPTIYTDSRLMLGQLQLNWNVKAKNLVPMYLKAKELLEFSRSLLIWVPRTIIVERLGH